MYFNLKMLNNIFRIICFVLLVFITVAYNISTTYLTKASNLPPNLSLTTDIELLHISEELFRKCSNELYKQVYINYQNQTSSKNFTDNSPDRLLIMSADIFLTTSTTRSLIKLFDNYELDTYKTENITKEKGIEEDEFINALMMSDVMLYVMDFLSSKSFFVNDLQIYKNILKEIWFHPYSRNKGINSSSGFEHVFVGERKPRKGVIGLHNWIFFSLAELSNKINYFGFSKKIEFTDKAAVLDTHFTYNRKRKISTLLIGTLPELEIALYTLCFFTRPNKKCNVSCNELKLGIQTHTIRNGNRTFIATAFPRI